MGTDDLVFRVVVKPYFILIVGCHNNFLYVVIVLQKSKVNACFIYAIILIVNKLYLLRPLAVHYIQVAISHEIFHRKYN